MMLLDIQRHMWCPMVVACTLPGSHYLENLLLLLPLLLSTSPQLLVQNFCLLNHFNLFLSWTRVFQFGTFNLCISFLT